MWKSKKFIVLVMVAVVVLAGSVAGVAFAQTGTAATSGNLTLLDRVVAILNQKGINVDKATLQSAFTQAQKEQRDAALDKRLQNQVAAGKITADDAAKYKAWLNAKPNVPLPGGTRPFGMHRFPGKGGMMGGRFFGAPAPTAPTP